jgi:hypothetical protein
MPYSERRLCRVVTQVEPPGQKTLVALSDWSGKSITVEATIGGCLPCFARVIFVFTYSVHIRYITCRTTDNSTA